MSLHLHACLKSHFGEQPSLAVLSHWPLHLWQPLGSDRMAMPPWCVGTPREAWSSSLCSCGLHVRLRGRNPVPCRHQTSLLRGALKASMQERAACVALVPASSKPRQRSMSGAPLFPALSGSPFIQRSLGLLGPVWMGGSKILDQRILPFKSAK